MVVEMREFAQKTLRERYNNGETPKEAADKYIEDTYSKYTDYEYIKSQISECVDSGYREFLEKVKTIIINSDHGRAVTKDVCAEFNRSAREFFESGDDGEKLRGLIIKLNADGNNSYSIYECFHRTRDVAHEGNDEFYADYLDDVYSFYIKWCLPSGWIP